MKAIEPRVEGFDDPAFGLAGWERAALLASAVDVRADEESTQDFTNLSAVIAFVEAEVDLAAKVRELNHDLFKCEYTRV